MSDKKRPTIEQLTDPFVLELIEGLARRDDDIEELEAENERLTRLVREAYETDHNSSLADWWRQQDEEHDNGPS